MECSPETVLLHIPHIHVFLHQLGSVLWNFHLLSFLSWLSPILPYSCLSWTWFFKPISTSLPLHSLYYSTNLFPYPATKLAALWSNLYQHPVTLLNVNLQPPPLANYFELRCNPSSSQTNHFSSTHLIWPFQPIPTFLLLSSLYYSTYLFPYLPTGWQNLWFNPYQHPVHLTKCC